ncbi:MAG TPA: TadE/TadG family type IV pilus assembly protein [Bryobacteraceae bacterium]|nr:TadE/TadG family type IV pilus assembly protein [Bryobacteraceae bacterium]
MKRCVNVEAGRKAARRGSTLIEFALVAVQLCLVLFSIIEFSRMVLVSTTVAHAARTAVRYAIVHGGTRTGSGVDGPSGPDGYTEISSNAKAYARSGLLDTGRMTVTVNYPDGNNDVGSRVSVTVVYPYDPFVVLPLRFNLGSTTQGVICF